MLKVNDDFKAVVLEASNSFICHQEVLFRRGFEGLDDIQQPRFEDENGDGDVPLAGNDELHVGPLLNAGAATSCSAEQSQLHCACVCRVERGGQVGNKLRCAGETYLRIVDAKRGHALQKADGAGHRDIDIGLLHSVAQTGFKQLDSWWFSWCHLIGFLAG